jgi:hypothetical protein
MRAAFFALVTTLAFSATVQAQLGHIAQAIVGGEVLDEAVLSPTAMLGLCDGTLVSPNVLLTAAHCVGAPPAYATFGASEQEARVVVEVERCVAHPEFERSSGHDLAFCIVRGDTSAIRPATLIGHTDELSVGEDVVLVGHGYTTGDGSDRTRLARWVTVRVDAIDPDGGELVVGDTAHGACHGDSGGSAFVPAADGHAQLAGVVSRRGPGSDAVPGATCASTTLLTALQPHLAWLAQNAHVQPSAAPHGAINAGCATAGGARSSALHELLLGLLVFFTARGASRSLSTSRRGSKS